MIALLIVYFTKEIDRRKQGGKYVAPKSTRSELCKPDLQKGLPSHLAWSNARDVWLWEGQDSRFRWLLDSRDFLSRLTYT